jgi:hypothetical protein
MHRGMPSEWGFEIFDFECFSNKLPNSMSLRLLIQITRVKRSIFEFAPQPATHPLLLIQK